MPRGKGWRRSEARKSALRKATKGKTTEDGDGPDCLPDGGRDDPADLTDIGSVPLAGLPAWPSVHGYDLKTEADSDAKMGNCDTVFDILNGTVNDMCFETAKETGSGANIGTCSDAKVRTGSGANIKTGIDANIETGFDANIETDFGVNIETGFGASTENCDTMIDILNDNVVEMCFGTANETGSGTNNETSSDANTQTGSDANIETDSGANTENGSDATIKTGSAANMETGSCGNIETCIDANFETGSGANVKTGSDANIETGSVANFETSSFANVESGYGTKMESDGTVIDILNDTVIERHCFYRIGNLPDVIMNKNKDLRDIEAMNVESIPELEVRAPFNFDTLVFGSFCQSSTRFLFTSRGSQCTINSLCALIYADYSRLSTKANLDEVLNVGDRLYKSVIDNLKCQGKFKHRLLCLDEIPDQVNILSRYINIEKANIISGVAVGQVDRSTLPSLHQSLQSVFCNNHYVLVLTGAVCSAVFVKDNKFWLFDSHSHGKHGLSSPDGKSVLLSFTVLDDLIRFMYAMYESMMIDLSCQFEILPLQFTSSGMENSSTTDLISKYFEDQNKRNQSIVSKKSINQRDDNCFSNKATLRSVASELRSKDRHEYFKRYRQMKRTDKEFKEKERKIQTASKRKARDDKEFKEKERKFQTTSKRKARDDKEFKEKERKIQTTSKRKERGDKEFKEKERKIQTTSKRKERGDKEFKEKERKIQTTSKRKERGNKEFKEKEQKIQTISKRKERGDKEFKEKERKIQTTSKRKERGDKEFKEKE